MRVGLKKVVGRRRAGFFLGAGETSSFGFGGEKRDRRLADDLTLRSLLSFPLLSLNPRHLHLHLHSSNYGYRSRYCT
jgi:hypothetical protein